MNVPRGNGARTRRTTTRSERAGVSKARTLAPGELVAGATGSTSLPLSDRDTAWDAGAAKKSLAAGQFSKAFFWRDASKPADQVTSYKLGFATAGGGALTAVWRGVTAAAGAVQGARGGVDIPDGDVAGVKTKIDSYYAKARKKFGDDSIKAPWDSASADAATIFESFGIETASLGITEFDEITVAAAALAYAEAADPETFSELYQGWRVALGAEPDDELVGNTTTCSNCEHPGSMHADTSDGDNMGACAAEDCDCSGMTTASADAETATVRDPLHIAFELTDFRLLDEIPEHELARVGRTVYEARDARLAAADTPAAPTLPTAPEEQPTRQAGLRWSAIFAPEGKLTDDGRAFAPGSIKWRDLPLTLMGMIETSEGGHIGAELCGRIEQIWRDDEAGQIRAEGVFDNGEYGQEIARLVGDQTLRGVSVDLAIHDFEFGPRSNWFDENGNWAPKPDEERAAERNPLDILFGDEASDEPIVLVVHDAVIGMTTVCPFPAFADARIEIGNALAAAAVGNPLVWTISQQAGWVVTPQPTFTITAATPGTVAITSSGQIATITETGPVEPEPLTAAAAGLAPVEPPAEWFDDPAFTELTPLTVDEQGRVSGHAAAWGSCHIAFPDTCVSPPHSNTGYAYFHLKEIFCDGGATRKPCGTITLDTGHAAHRLSRAEATSHYDDTGTAVADVRVGEDEFGIWVSGALRPDVDAEKARELRGAVLSGDWRNVDGNLELVALLAVNVPGFPVPRSPSGLVAAGETVSLVAAGITTAGQTVVPVVDTETLAKLAAVRARIDDRYSRLAELAERAGA